MYNLVIIGEMGSGKNYIMDKCIERYDIEKIVTDCTRPIRNGEKNGVDYNFLTKEEFLDKLENGGYIEYQKYDTVHGSWYYGTNTDSIKKDNTVIILDKDGYLAYKEHVPNCIGIFLSCIDETERFYKSIKRLNDCNMKDVDEVYRRIKKDEEKFKDIHDLVDFVIPQTYNETTINMVFDILDRIGFKKR